MLSRGFDISTHEDMECEVMERIRRASRKTKEDIQAQEPELTWFPKPGVELFGAIGTERALYLSES